MKKQIFHLQEPFIDLFQVKETTEPLIIWSLRIGESILSMPELTDLVQQYFFFNWLSNEKLNRSVTLSQNG